MSDEELPLSAELASAYLDGELDATERAAAAADPDVMQAVASIARVRAALGEVAPVVASTKTAAIAAALAEFDALHATAEPVVAPVAVATVISMQARRQRAYRALTRVAAVLVVGVVVVTALKALGGGESKDSATSATAFQPAATEAPQLKIAADTASPAAATEAAAGTVAAGANSAAGSTTADVPEVDSDEALKQYAASFEAQAAAPTAAATETSVAAAATAAPAPAAGGFASIACLSSDQTLLGSIIFQGTPAYAVHDAASGTVQAIDQTDCRVLREVDAP